MLAEWMNAYIKEWVNIANQISYFCYPKIKEIVLQWLTLSSTLLYIRLTSISNSCPDAIQLPLKKSQSGDFNLFALQIISFSSVKLSNWEGALQSPLMWGWEWGDEKREKSVRNTPWTNKRGGGPNTLKKKNQPRIYNYFCLLKSKSKTNLT